MNRSPLRPSRNRRLQAARLLAFLIPAGLLWRSGALPLRPFASKYGGSTLWAAAVYACCALLLPRWTPPRTTVFAAMIAAAVEFFKLVYWPPLDRFRATLAGKLLLGRYFSVGALLAYAVALAGMACLDALRPGKRDLGRPMLRVPSSEAEGH